MLAVHTGAAIVLIHTISPSSMSAFDILRGGIKFGSNVKKFEQATTTSSAAPLASLDFFSTTKSHHIHTKRVLPKQKHSVCGNCNTKTIVYIN